jgi:hypothetical protein
MRDRRRKAETKTAFPPKTLHALPNSPTAVSYLFLLDWIILISVSTGAGRAGTTNFSRKTSK